MISKWLNLRYLDPLLILNIKDTIFILVLAEYYTSGKIFICVCMCMGVVVKVQITIKDEGHS